MQKPMGKPHKPTVAVVKFASCDGCQLTLLNCEEELLALADRIEFAHFAERPSSYRRTPRAEQKTDHHRRMRYGWRCASFAKFRRP